MSTSSSQPDSPQQPIVLSSRRRRTEQERRLRVRRIAAVAGVLALLLALVIPVTGYYVVFVRPLQATALVINERSYSWGDYLTRTRMLIAQAQATGVWQPDSMTSLLFDMIEEMERQEIIKQFAPQEGVTATPQEVQQEVRVRILGRGAADDPSISEREFSERYGRRLDLLKISESQFEDVARTAVLRRRLEEALKQQVPAKVEQRHLFAIQVTELDQARAVLDRIDGGEDFSTVAADVSRDTQTKDQGGDMGWVPLGIRDEIDEVLLVLKDGGISAPLYGQAGVYLYMAVGEPEVRDVSERHRSRLESRAMNAWLLERRNELIAAGALARPGGGLSTDRYNWVLNQLTQDRELFPRRTVSG